MDKNTITGLVLIGILLVGFSFLSRPSEEQIAAQKKYYDSIALVQQQEEALKAKTEAALANNKKEAATTADSSALFYAVLVIDDRGPQHLSDFRRRRSGRIAGTQQRRLRRHRCDPPFGRFGRTTPLYESRRLALSRFRRNRAQQLAHDHPGRASRFQGSRIEHGQRIGGDDATPPSDRPGHPLSGTPSGQLAYHRRDGQTYGIGTREMYDQYRPQR